MLPVKGTPSNSVSRVADLLRESARQLQQAGVPNWRLEAYLLLQHCLDCSRSQLILWYDHELTSGQLRCHQEALKRRCSREPLAHITGSREFWSLDFLVSPAVLIPRPETELLVEQALRLADFCGTPAAPLLDMCTGSGIIAVVLAKELRRPVVAVDMSLPALAIARANCLRHGVGELVSLCRADLFSALQPRQQFAMIITNPPYVAQAELEDLEPEVRDHEPHPALTDGEDGLALINKILAQAASYLIPGGYLLMEIGAGQQDAVLQAAAADWPGCQVKKDLSGRPRLFMGQVRSTQ